MTHGKNNGRRKIFLKKNFTKETKSSLSGDDSAASKVTQRAVISVSSSYSSSMLAETSPRGRGAACKADKNKKKQPKSHMHSTQVAFQPSQRTSSAVCLLLLIDLLVSIFSAVCPFKRRKERAFRQSSRERPIPSNHAKKKQRDRERDFIRGVRVDMHRKRGIKCFPWAGLLMHRAYYSSFLCIDTLRDCCAGNPRRWIMNGGLGFLPLVFRVTA